MLVDGVTGGAGPGGASSAGTGIAANFDNFLTLLTAQLQNQDPLSPLDANAFTQQLVQFTSVEQAIQTNENLSQLIGIMRAGEATQALDYIGTVVETAGDTFVLDGGRDARVRYALDSDAAGVTLRVLDPAGNMVLQTEGAGNAGLHEFVWSGLGSDGRMQTEGIYRIQIDARDADDQPLSVDTRIEGTVDAVEIQDGDLLLSVGGIPIPLDDVRAVRRPVTPVAEAA